MPILVFLGLSVLDLGVRDRQTDVTQHHRLMSPPSGRGIMRADRKALEFIGNKQNHSRIHSHTDNQIYILVFNTDETDANL